MTLYFYKTSNGAWGCHTETTQFNVPAILEQEVKAAIAKAVKDFNEA